MRGPVWKSMHKEPYIKSMVTTFKVRNMVADNEEYNE